VDAERVEPQIFVDFFEVGGAELVGVGVIAEEEEVSPIAFDEAEAHGAALEHVAGVEVVFDGFIEDTGEELGGGCGVGEVRANHRFGGAAGRWGEGLGSEGGRVFEDVPGEAEGVSDCVKSVEAVPGEDFESEPGEKAFGFVEIGGEELEEGG
jgi:hypothetical protein